MINIQTYLGTKDLDTYFEELSNPKKFFINIDEFGAKETLNRMLTKNKGIDLYGVVCIQINGVDVSTFIDWDDIDLMWTALLTMVREYVDDGKYSETQMFINGLEWSIKKIQSSPKDLVLFKVLRNNALFDLRSDLPVPKEARVSCNEIDFLRAVVIAGEKYLFFRDEDTRTHNLIEAKRLLKELKCGIKDMN